MPDAEAGGTRVFPTRHELVVVVRQGYIDGSLAAHPRAAFFGRARASESAVLPVWSALFRTTGSLEAH